MRIDGGTFYACDREDHTLFVENHTYSGCYRFYVVLDGELIYTDGNKSIRMREGNILVLSPEQKKVLAARPQVSCRQLILYLPEETSKKLYLTNSGIHILSVQKTQNELSCMYADEGRLKKLVNIFRSLEQECSEPLYEEERMKNLYLCEWVLTLNRICQPEQKHNGLIAEVTHYLDITFSEDISLDELGAKFYISKFHLLREFKKQVGKTIHEYIIGKRIEFVKVRMEEGQSI